MTNPPIDPIREEIVVSLVCLVGPEGSLLSELSSKHCQRLVMRHPAVLTLEEMCTLKNCEVADDNFKFKTTAIDTTYYPAGSGPVGMRCFKLWNKYDTKLLKLFKEISEKKVCRLFTFPTVWSGPDRMPLPTRSVPLDEVEPASAIVKRFASGDRLPLPLLTMSWLGT